ncbi:MAG: HlyD family type I secretion periplasmic adaptor subunit [Alphaproteobacteria bacterium]|nr:HlyD family type I secretion periplasmic adaptor subunit [Alphaproteobacteria bacterium]
MTKMKIELNDMDLRKLDLTRKYDEDFAEDEGISWRDHLLLYTITTLVVIFIVWAKFTTLDEVSRGDGKVIPSSEVQVIQNLEGGIIDEFLVDEGKVVQAGDIILRMRNVQARSDFETTNQRYLGLLAAVTRLQAEVDGKAPVFPEDVIRGVPDSVTAEKAAFAANEQQLESQKAVLKQQKSQKEQEAAELQRRIADLGSVMKLTKDERNMVAPMVKRGAAAEKELLQLDRQIAQQRTELNGLKLALPRSQAAVKEAEERLAELENSRKADAQRELTEKTIELNAIKETLAAYQDKSARTEIRSPVTGTVKDIKVKTVGGVVRPGEPIMEIVPLEDQLIVEARIRPADIAFIHPGQKATVRLTAFDFSIYGALDGEVTDISADTITNEQGESFYRVKIRTTETKLERRGKVLEIMPGMQATVDIVTGEKSVMTYIMRPLAKASHTALRER